MADDRPGVWELARVRAVVPDSERATTLRLELPEAPNLLPGQYYLVRLAIESPPGAVQQAYSVSSSPEPPSPQIDITVREVEGGRASPLLVRQVQAGDLVQVRGPYGFLTWTERDGGPLGLIGGGSGVAPLVSIVRYAAARRIGTPMTMLCSSRDRTTVLLRDALTELSREHRWFRLVHTFTRSPADASASFHRRIDLDLLAAAMTGSDGDVVARSYYLAGPSGMVLSARRALGALGVPDDRIYSEDHA